MSSFSVRSDPCDKDPVMVMLPVCPTITILSPPVSGPKKMQPDFVPDDAATMETVFVPFSAWRVIAPALLEKAFPVTNAALFQRVTLWRCVI